VTPADGRSSAGRGTKARAAQVAGAKGGSRNGPRSKPSSEQTTTAASARRLDPDRLAALEEERDFLLRSLRDLEAEHDVGDVDDGDYAALKDDYTARAAATIRAIDGHQQQLSAARPTRSPTRRIAIAAAVAVFAIGTGVLVAQWSGARGAGDSITGGIRGDTRDELLEARQAFSQNPPDYLQAIKVYDRVLQQDPANVEALAYRGWMYRLVSLQASGTQRTDLQIQARDSLAQALRTDSKDPTSLIFMAAVLDDLGQPAQALADLDAVPPSQIPSVVTGLVAQLRAQVTSQLHSSTSTTSP
jgi:tetratricopeptide (TPR) repeat protein